MIAESTAKALGGHRAGAIWMARCPAQEDRKPSLSISSGRNGKVLVRCHAGCGQRDVIAILRQRGLWKATRKSWGRFARKSHVRVSDEPDANAVKRSEAGDKARGPLTALTHRLLADETLRQALVEPIIRNIAAGSIATVVHHRRGAE